MDIVRDKPRPIGKYILTGIGVAALVAATVFLMRLKPAVPGVQADMLYVDTVKRGEMVREVRGSGTLVPENLQLITAGAGGSVERINLLPGAAVEPNTILMVLVNPTIQIDRLQADKNLSEAQSKLVQLQASLEIDRLTQASHVEDIEQQAKDARRRADAGADLLKKGLVIPLDQQKAEDIAKSLEAQLKLEKSRLEVLTSTIPDQIRVQKDQIDWLTKISEQGKIKEQSLQVKARVSGRLQEIPVHELGQYAQEGTVLAKVVPTPGGKIQLKAVVKIPENQAKDLAVGLKATIDTRNVKVTGRVTRIDLAPIAGSIAVDIALDEVPEGARPDLSIEGIIEIERISNVLYMDRPTNVQQNSPGTVFKLVEGGKYAERVSVRFGRTSVSNVEITDGLQPDDVIIMTDLSKFGDADRLRIKD